MQTALRSTPVQLLTALDAVLLAEALPKRERRLARVQRTVERRLARAFRTQGRLFVQGFRTLRYLFPVPEAGLIRESISPSDWLPLFIAAATTTLELFIGSLDDAAQYGLLSGALAQIGEMNAFLSFDLNHPAAVAYLDRYGANRVANIDDTTQDYLRTTIRDGVEAGDSPRKIEQAIIDRYQMFAVGKPQQHIQSRAHFIAVTEMGNAYEHGRDVVVRDLQAGGLRFEKKWAGPDDKRTSQACHDNMAQGWISYDLPFQSGDHRPLHHPGCRHTLMTRRKRDD